MSDTGELFDATPYTVEPPTTSTIPDRPNLSAGQRLTLRQSNDITRGIHPLTGGPLHPNAPRDAARTDRGRPTTCGVCPHLITTQPGANRYTKCDLGPITGGPATDVRAWWPACDRYEGTPTP